MIHIAIIYIYWVHLMTSFEVFTQEQSSPPYYNPASILPTPSPGRLLLSVISEPW